MIPILINFSYALTPNSLNKFIYFISTFLLYFEPFITINKKLKI